jgi:hypothetical protein
MAVLSNCITFSYPENDAPWLKVDSDSLFTSFVQRTNMLILLEAMSGDYRLLAATLRRET